MILRAATNHLFQQDLRKMPDAHNMLSGFHTAVFDDGGHRFHHGGAGMTQHFVLLLYHLFQIPFMQMQLHDILNTVQHGIGFIINRDYICSSQIKGPVQPDRIIILSKDNNLRHMKQLHIFLFPDQHFFFIRHCRNIQEQRCNTMTVLLQQHHCLIDIHSFQQIETPV